MWQRQRFRHNEPRHQSSFPCTRPLAPDVAFGNTLTTTNKNTDNEAVIPSFNTRCTMDPRLREDDVRRDKKRLTNRSDKKKVRRVKDERKHQQRHYPIKNQRTAAIPPAVIPVHTGIHSFTHARCRVWKRTRHNQQLHRAKPITTLAMKR